MRWLRAAPPATWAEPYRPACRGHLVGAPALGVRSDFPALDRVVKNWGHGPELSPRGRGVPRGDPRLAGGEPAGGLVRRGLLDDAGGEGEVQRGVDPQAPRGRIELRQLTSRVRQQ